MISSLLSRLSSRRNRAVLLLVAIVAGVGSVAGFSQLAGAHPGAHQLSIADVSAAEGDGGTTANGTMTISISPPPVIGETVTVNWATSVLGSTASPSADATVVYPEDFATSGDSVTFEEGDASMPITIPILRDDVGEGAETFKVNIFGATTECDVTCTALGASSAAISDGQGVYTITDDDVPSIAISDITNKPENDDAPSATTAFTFVVTRTGASALDVSAGYATQNGSAEAPADYTATTGTVTVPASLDATEDANIVVTVIDDSADESTEAFRVNLTTPVNCTISDNQGTATILDDDPAPDPTASVSDATIAEGGQLTFNVTLSEPPSFGDSATVNYATSDGTAKTSSNDYTAASGTLTYGPGESTQPVTVNSLEDIIDETDETLTLTLTKPGACCTGYDYDLGDATGTGTITDDDAVPGTLTINNVAVDEGDSGTTAAVFTVTRNNSEQAVTVDYTTANNTAAAPDDFTATSGTLTFSAAQNTRTITVNVNGDTDIEPSETYFVNLSNATGVTIADNQGIGAINNDDEVVVDETPHDFNGDGFADAVFGAPGEAIGSATKAGAVSVVYGSETGLTSTDDQVWHQNITDVDGTAASNDRFGAAVAAGDFDGDGFDDLAIGIPGETASAGAVSVLYGSEEGLTADDQLWSQASTDVEGTIEDGDGFGNAVAAGDLNGDGFADLAIGVSGEDTAAGAVNVLYGTSEGLDAADDQLFTQNSTDIEDAPSAGDRFGGAVAAGDVNGDGIADLVVGVRGEDVGAISDAGAIHVIFGTESGLDGADSAFIDQDDTGVLDATEATDGFGSSLAVGDTDDDGFADVAVGAPREDVGSVVDAGAANLLFGSEAGLDGDGSQLWHQNSTGIEGTAENSDLFAFSVSIGDLNGDGFGDLAAGAPGESLGSISKAGLTSVIYGSDGGLSDEGNQFWTQDSSGIGGAAEKSDLFGSAVSSADFDADGDADLVNGAPGEDIGEAANAGAANVINGDTDGLTADADQVWHQDISGMGGVAEDGDVFGTAV